MKQTVIVAALVFASAALAQGKPAQKAPAAQKAETAHAILKDAKGKRVGEVKLTQAPNSVVVRVDITHLPPGVHAFHVHEIGNCQAPFTSAGGHFNPEGKQHGVMNPEGRHAGDLPNLHVPKSGKLQVTYFLDQASLHGKNALLDKDGAAFVVHQGADDYQSNPAGAAGARIACGVLQP